MNSSEIMYLLSIVLVAQVAVLGLFIYIAWGLDDKKEYEEYFNAAQAEKINT